MLATIAAGDWSGLTLNLLWAGLIAVVGGTGVNSAELYTPNADPTAATFDSIAAIGNGCRPMSRLAA